MKPTSRKEEKNSSAIYYLRFDMTIYRCPSFGNRVKDCLYVGCVIISKDVGTSGSGGERERRIKLSFQDGNGKTRGWRRPDGRRYNPNIKKECRRRERRV